MKGEKTRSERVQIQLCNISKLILKQQGEKGGRGYTYHYSNKETNL